MPQPVENRLGQSVFCLFSENSFFHCFRLLLYIQFLHQTTLTSQTLNASRRLSLAKKGHFKLNSQFSKLEKWVASDTSCACCSLISSLAYFYFPLFWGMVMYDNQFETKENNIYTKIKLNQDIIIRVNVYAATYIVHAQRRTLDCTFLTHIILQYMSYMCLTTTPFTTLYLVLF